MKTAIQQLQFLYTWRPYQAKVLDNFSAHIEDNHFHIVAPPGSGKTILGLEIIKRIGKKTLVLAPTLTIRNQWEDRLQNFFTKQESFSKFSFDLKQPSDITFTTYQSLHSFYKTFQSKEAYFQFFVDHEIDVLLLDEAHHLKNEWWKCLYALKEQHLQTIVALTATPPYDSEHSEIHKYFNLCGEIDDEIVVPDLVKARNLCPHQDMVFLSKPEDQEINFITDFRLKISDFVSRLLKDKEFIEFLQLHRFYTNTEAHLDQLYQHTDAFSAMLIFLNAAKLPIPFEKLHLLGFEQQKDVSFPDLSNEWVELLFQFLLVTDRENLIQYETYLLLLEKQLRTLSVFNNKKVNLVGNDLLYKSLSNSPSKLKSITKIVQQETKNLQDDLRCVVLSDYIRKEYLNTSSDAINEIQKLGVVPIFHHVRTTITQKEYVAILTGSLVVIHSSKLSKFELIDDLSQYSYTALISDPEYLIISPKSNSKNTIVNTMTVLFEQGHIKVLIGTKSLLGEGWDAPTINSLILASVVGSFVTSNQMRGRAIRVNSQDPNKVGLIWHLACIDPTDSKGGRDLAILSKRFEAFLGISNGKTLYISNGLERLQLPTTIFAEDIKVLNEQTLDLSAQRTAIAQRWKKAIFNGKSVVKQLKLIQREDQYFAQQKHLYYKDIVKYSIGELLIGLSFFLPNFLIKNLTVLIHKGVLYFLSTLLVGLGLSFGYKIYTSIQMYTRYGLIYKKVRKMGLAVLDTLYELELMQTPRSQIKIEATLLSEGNVVCTIKGANRYESSLFINSLNELLQPIHNPRYLLIKTNWLRNKLKIQNFFAIPEVLSPKKNIALSFQKHWRTYLGSSKLVYTRNLEGRKLLLKARLHHMQHTYNEMIRKNVIWK